MSQVPTAGKWQRFEPRPPGTGIGLQPPRLGAREARTILWCALYLFLWLFSF